MTCESEGGPVVVDGDEGPRSSQTPRGSTGTRKAYPSRDTKVRFLWDKAILAVGSQGIPQSHTIQ